jgi:hypothetical protein
MLKRFKLFTLLSATGLVVTAQPDAVLGKPFPVEKRGEVNVIAANKANLVAMHTNSSGFKFNRDFYRFDKNTVSFQGAFDPISKGGPASERDFYTSVSMRGKIYLFYSVYDGKADKFTLYALGLGEDAKPSGSMMKVLEMEAKKSRNRGDYKIALSKDSTKICVIASPPMEKNSNEKLILATFDQNLKNLNSTQISLDYKDNKFIPGNFIFANDGDLLMQATVKVEKKDREKGDPRTFPTIFKISTIDGKMDEYQIKVPGMNVNDVDFNLDNNGKLLCAGFYGDPKKGGRSDLDGIYYLRIDKQTKTIEKTSLKPLPDDIVVELIGERKARKERGISNNFQINYFIPRTDGNTMIVGQYYDYYTVTTYNPQTKSTQTTHHWILKGPLVLNVDKGGEITWAKMLPMKQHFSSSRGGASIGFFTYTFALPAPDHAGYKVAYTKDKIFFVYNDHKTNREKNLNTQKDAKTISTPKFMVPVAAEMDNAGNFSIKQAFNHKTEKTAFTMNIGDIVAIEHNVLVATLNSQVGFFRTCFNFCTFGAVPLNRQGKLAKLTFK